MRYRLLIFDFDGTLADSFPVFLAHLREVVDHFKLHKIEEHTLDELRGRGARQVLDCLRLPAWKVPLVVRRMRRLMSVDASRTRLFPGIPEVLRRLAESGCVLAIVSSNSEVNIRAILGPEDSARISVYACGASLFGKAAKFRRVLKRTALPSSQALAIGDEIRDLEAAREAGIEFGAVAWGYTKVEALRACLPAFVFQRPEDLLGLPSQLP